MATGRLREFNILSGPLRLPDEAGKFPLRAGILPRRPVGTTLLCKKRKWALASGVISISFRRENILLKGCNM